MKDRLSQSRAIIDYARSKPNRSIKEVAEHFNKTENEIHDLMGLVQAIPEAHVSHKEGRLNLLELYIFSILHPDTQRLMLPLALEMQLSEWMPLAFIRNKEIIDARKRQKRAK